MSVKIKDSEINHIITQVKYGHDSEAINILTDIFKANISEMDKKDCPNPAALLQSMVLDMSSRLKETGKIDPVFIKCFENEFLKKVANDGFDFN